MSCDDLDLDAWCLGLADREADEHLSWCAACAEEARTARLLVERLSSLPAVAESAALEARILARAFPRRRSRLPAAAAAALILALFAPWEPREPAPERPSSPAAAPPLADASAPPPPLPLHLAEAEEVEIGVDLPPLEPATEAVAYSWEEASARPAPWEEVEPERRDETVRAGPLYAGWERDDELGGAALVGLSLKF